MNELHQDWWESPRHFGLLLNLSQARHIEQEYSSEELPVYRVDRLRREMQRFESGQCDAGPWVAWVLDNICGFNSILGSKWKRGSDVPVEFSRVLLTGESFHPRQLWRGPCGAALPVFIEKHFRVGIGRGRRTLSQVHEWLRSAEQPFALLTNGMQWRLVYAGPDYEAACEWDAAQWFTEGQPGVALASLRQLLQPALFVPAGEHEPAPLEQAVSASRKGQSELSAGLGSRVREAVEVLVHAHGDALRQAGLDAHGADIYRAAARTIMRMVVILFAESRDLLPCSQPLYYDNYSLQGLFEQLQRLALRGRGRLAHRYGAWPRILALFRLVHDGSHHEALTIQRYGGTLFAPGAPADADPMRHALGIFEAACFDTQQAVMPDADVHRILELLTRTRVRIRQGRGSTSVLMPVDFSELSSEYIGILYEGLLDYELRTASADDPVLFLAVGKEPALPLSRLEAMSDQDIKTLFEKLKKDKDDKEEESEEEEQPESGEEEESEELIEDEAVDAADDDLDEARLAREKAYTWAHRACQAAGLAPKIRDRITPEKRMEHDRKTAAAARGLIRKIVLPGGWYLVRWGGTRKGKGSFYTRPQLVEPTVRRTLEPLVREEDRSRLPEEILALKVCDPACGSGSFLVGALRFMTDALYRSLHEHKRFNGEHDRTFLHLFGDKSEMRINGEGALSNEYINARPEDDDFEERLKAQLRRHIVERCLYGVDLDPLAVELARLSLWIETMHRDLPFSFLDHKIKCGNALIGCWFDRFRHYPAMAWKNRDGGDSTHTNGVHYEQKERTKALKAFDNNVLKADIEQAIDRHAYEQSMNRTRAAQVHDGALKALRELHALPVHDAEGRAEAYHQLQEDKDWQTLKTAFDAWCACWFWPVDHIDQAPLPTTFACLPEQTRSLVRELAARKRFFHWELEFPDAFDRPDSGFNAILGNPPWDVAKPSSKEFFSNLDPLYRTYGKQEALKTQTELFEKPDMESEWLDYQGDFKAQSHFAKYAARPFGDPQRNDTSADRFSIVRGKRNNELHTRWRSERSGDKGYADPQHAFQHQGSADINLYKLFLEQSHVLLRPGGRLGFIVPSGLYSDHGSGALRELFLDHCRWEWLFGFENREKVFDIDGRFKFNPVIIRKGGRTEAIQAAFMRRDLTDWARAETLVVPYSREQVDRFSPQSQAILEIQSERDLEILEKIYANSVLLGDQGPDGWGIKYSTEFHMTNDSNLFPPRPKWEEKGYRPDEYSRWLKGNWQPVSNLWKTLEVDFPTIGKNDAEISNDWKKAEKNSQPLVPPSAGLENPDRPRLRIAQPPYDQIPIPRADIPPGIILSREADAYIREDEIEDVALPLYEGRMIGQFDFSQKGWVSGKGRTAVWRDIPWAHKVIEPQYLMAQETFQKESLKKYLDQYKKRYGADAAEAEEGRLCSPDEFAGWWLNWNIKCSIMDVTSSTNTRTTIGTVSLCVPHGHKTPVMKLCLGEHVYSTIGLVAVLNSFIFDWLIRLRLSGNSLIWAALAETACLRKQQVLNSYLIESAKRTAVTSQFFPSLETLHNRYSNKLFWALTHSEQIRNRVIQDVLIAEHFKLSYIDLNDILIDCDHPSGNEVDKDPKGFWRVDKDKDPELRHTVLTLVAFHDLQEKIQACGGDRDAGIQAFMEQNDGEGWMLPETLRLADYGLGHDERAQEHQPVASRLGPRFLDWQLEQSAEESWRECELHARNLLGKEGFKALKNQNTAGKETSSMKVKEDQIEYAPAGKKMTQGTLFDEAGA
ncbi:MAG: hypothetical protein EOM20_02445 [Spartobacteria bacterium]|nr:hypothetical protein [Spartobacteria bacterium]